MFTGIVDHCAIITAISVEKHSTQLTISTQFTDLALGESVCVDGICLTVTALDRDQFQCDLSSETLQLTCAKNYLIGAAVNVERAMKMHDRLSGHMVTGHVDGILKVSAIDKEGDFVVCEFSDVLKKHCLLLTEKGSVCVNGVSLTINRLGNSSFSVMLIPHTLQRTNLGVLTKNNFVNVEYDYLAKLVQRNLSHTRSENYVA